MSLLDELKEKLGMKTVSFGDLNRHATYKPPIKRVPAKRPSVEGIEITEEYLQVTEMITAGFPVIFVNGKAGTGKTTLINYLHSTLDKNIVVVAPTGVAALNVSGATIHSYFRLPARVVTDADIKEVRDRKLYSKLELLIIDEISMVRVDLIDAIDKFLRLNGKHKGKSFGGTQLLFVGDMFQLPPVVTKKEQALLNDMNYSSPYFFSAHSLENIEMGSVELSQIFRQRDPEFAGMLNQIRVAENLDAVIPEINEACKEGEDRTPLITLSCTNKVADDINQSRLGEIKGKGRTYLGKTEGKFSLEEERLPSPMNLALKSGAQVMFTKNDISGRWVNGTLGKVVELHLNSVDVELVGDQAGVVYSVEKADWDSYSYEYDKETDKIVPVVAGKYTQLPLMLAWVVTIHKSQGKTLERVKVDLGTGAFASGQVYVALSRCRSLKDISLTRPIKISEVKCDPIILRFNQMLSAKTEQEPE